MGVANPGGAEKVLFEARARHANVETLQAVGVFPKKILLTPARLLIGKKLEISLGSIQGVFAIDRGVRVFYRQAETDMVTGLYLGKSRSKRFKTALDRACSAIQIQNRIAEYESQGKKPDMRIASCPQCEAFLDLSRFPASPQAYCEYCGSIGGEEGKRPEVRYGFCDQCRFYSRIDEYKFSFAYFALVVHGSKELTMQACSSCAKSEGWKWLWKGLAFGTLFAPINLVVNTIPLVKSSRNARDVSVRGLERIGQANDYIKRRQIDQGLIIYREILEGGASHAGLLFNIGRASYLSNRKDEAAVMFQKAVEACSNCPVLYLSLEAVHREQADFQKADAVKEKIEHLWGPNKTT